MGTAVLRSEDCLRDRFPPETLISRSCKSGRYPNPNLNPNNANVPRPGRRKRSTVVSPERENRGGRSRTNVVKLPVKNILMGQVKILKRGEKLKPSNDPKSDDSDDGIKKKIENDVDSLCSTDRLGPEPDMVPKQIRLTDLKYANGLYAGSAFFSSPPPSSLPLPAFFSKKDVSIKIDAATTDLRRLLRLDFS